MLRRGVGALAVGGAGFAAYKALAPKGEEKDFGGGPLKKKIQRFNSLVERGQNPQEIKTRAEMIKSLQAGELVAFHPGEMHAHHVTNVGSEDAEILVFATNEPNDCVHSTMNAI
jgi:hypothetical protein